MDPIGVLPIAEITSEGMYSKAVRALGINNLEGLAKYLLEMPYGFPEGEGLLIALEQQKGTCTHKHGIYAAVAQEHQIPVVKCNGFYRLTAKIVPGIQKTLEENSVSWVPAAHCFLRYGPYRVDLTEGNCNGKETPLDSYLCIKEIPCDLPKAEADQMYKEFLEKEFPKWLGEGDVKSPSEWKTLYQSCCETLKLSVGCSIQPTR